MFCREFFGANIFGPFCICAIEIAFSNSDPDPKMFNDEFVQFSLILITYYRGEVDRHDSSQLSHLVLVGLFL